MKQRYRYDCIKTMKEDDYCRNFYYFKINIIKNNKKMYKIMCNGDLIDLDKEHMKDVRKRNDWKDDDCYTIVSLESIDLVAYYK